MMECNNKKDGELKRKWFAIGEIKAVDNKAVKESKDAAPTMRTKSFEFYVINEEGGMVDMNGKAFQESKRSKEAWKAQNEINFMKTLKRIDK